MVVRREVPAPSFLPLNGSGILSSGHVLLARAHRPNIAELEQSGGTDVDIRWCDA